MALTSAQSSTSQIAAIPTIRLISSMTRMMRSGQRGGGDNMGLPDDPEFSP